jgi:hypothetical protein
VQIWNLRVSFHFHRYHGWWIWLSTRMQTRLYRMYNSPDCTVPGILSIRIGHTHLSTSFDNSKPTVIQALTNVKYIYHQLWMYYVKVARKCVFGDNTNAEQPTINEIHLVMAIRNDPITEKITSRGRHQPEPIHMSTSRGRHQSLHHPLNINIIHS